MKLVLRPATENDLGLVLSATLHGMVGANSKLDKNLGYASFKSMLLRLFLIVDSVVAVDEEDPDTIFGFMLYKGSNLIYLYVRGPYRQMGVGTELMKLIPAPKKIAIATRASRYFMEKWELEFDSHILIELLRLTPGY